MSMEGNIQEFVDIQKAPLWAYLSNAAKRCFSSNDITILLKAQEEWAVKNFEAKELMEKEKMCMNISTNASQARTAESMKDLEITR